MVNILSHVCVEVMSRKVLCKHLSDQRFIVDDQKCTMASIEEGLELIEDCDWSLDSANGNRMLIVEPLKNYRWISFHVLVQQPIEPY